MISGLQLSSRISSVLPERPIAMMMTGLSRSDMTVAWVFTTERTPLVTPRLGFSRTSRNPSTRLPNRRPAPAFSNFGLPRPRDWCGVSFDDRAQVENGCGVRVGHGNAIACGEVLSQIFVVVEPPVVDGGDKKILSAFRAK